MHPITEDPGAQGNMALVQSGGDGPEICAASVLGSARVARAPARRAICAARV